MLYSHRQTNSYIFFHKSCPYEFRVFSNNNSTKCMLKLFADFVTNSHNVKRITTIPTVWRAYKTTNHI